MWEVSTDSSKENQQIDKTLRKLNICQILQMQVMKVIHPSNPLPEQNAKIEKVISQKCVKHPLKNAELLYLKSNVENARICITCVQLENIPPNNYLQIKDVLLSSWDSDLFAYPVLNKPKLQLLQAIKQNSAILDSDIKQIDAFFTEITKEIPDLIEENKKNLKLQLNKFEDIQQRYLDCWQSIVDIANLKQILYQDNNEAELVKFINDHIKNSENNTPKIQKIYDEFQDMKNQFSTEQPNKTRVLINSHLKEINFFDKSSSKPNDESNLLRKELLKKQQEVDQLQSQLNDCKAQIKKDQKTLQEQRSLIEQLQGQNNNQSIHISAQKQEVKVIIPRSYDFF